MSEPPSHTRFPLLQGLAVTLLTAGILLATEPFLAIAWDEGYTLGRVHRVRLWFQALRDPARFAAAWTPPRIESVQDRMPAPPPSAFDTRGELLSQPVLAWFWPFAREEPHGHPPFYAIAALIGDVLTPWRAPLPRARLGTMLAFSLAAGAIFAACRKRWGPWPAATAWAAFVLQPRLFAEAHYATYDALLTSLWVGATITFSAAIEPAGRRSPRWGWVILFGVLAGWAADTKLTGWFLPLPLATWVVWRGGQSWLIGRCDGTERRAVQALLVGGLVAAVVLYLFNPPWWPDPVAGVIRFFASNLTRAETIPIQTLFLGKVYETPAESLPWYNTLAWTLFVVPAGFLVLALIGASRTAIGLVSRAGRPPENPPPVAGEGGRAAAGRGGQAQVMARASSTAVRPPLPNPPPPGGRGPEQALPREGTRQPLAELALAHWAFFLVLRALPHTPGHDGIRQFLAAFGCLAILVAPGAAWAMRRSARLGKILTTAAIAEGALSVAIMMPVPLSYYSPLIGGLPGATRLGMEPTYYWDALTADALDTLNRRTPPGRTVLFSTNPTSWFYLHETKQLIPGIAPFDRGEPAWYVVQNRPGAMRPVDRYLVERAQPRQVLSSKLGVPLVWAFPIEQFYRAMAATEPAR